MQTVYFGKTYLEIFGRADGRIPYDLITELTYAPNKNKPDETNTELTIKTLKETYCVSTSLQQAKRVLRDVSET